MQHANQDGIGTDRVSRFVLVADQIDRFNVFIGRSASWLYAILTVVVLANVTLRYGFNRGSITMEEIQWHLMAAAFFLGFAYAYAEDAHVRVDILYERFSKRGKAGVELVFTLIFLLPFAGLIAYNSWFYFLESWELNEVSPEPGGLPARYAIKFLMFVSFVLLFVQGIAALLRSVATLSARGSRGV
ncbi:TRAP transporter small permease subunit [Lutimaribacter marinistellae]|uniref:TRAP transporter small permease protein n=1 Tax=Lutimaribacter marinistellae TaxID=1820329 RepID=A0ABV7TB79_9RHOB